MVPTVVKKPLASDNIKKETPKLTDIFKKEEKPAEQAVKVEQEDKRNEPVSLEKVEVSIQKYISEKNLSNTYLSLLKNAVKLISETTVEIQLKNSVEKKFLGEIEVELVHFLRNDLNNDYIMVSSTFNQEKSIRTAYTNAEIFDEMVEKNPELIRLKNELGLDTDF